MIPLSWYLIFAAAVFSIGLYGVLARKNIIAILMSIELMLTAININFIAFWRYSLGGQLAGQVFAVIVFAVSASEVAVGLALVISLYRRLKEVVAEDVNLLKW
jgi:NADH:ubiquinone oxidoreductase subunit K